MKFGSFTFQPQKPAGFDFNVLRLKVETGIRLPPVPDMYSNIAVFADNVAVKNHPDWISQSPLGPAKMGNPNFNIYWDVVCATQPEHRAEQLEYIKEVDRQSPGICLNNQYFADHGHCMCPRCKELWQKSGLSWLEWRRKKVTEYISQIRDVVKKELILSIQPDPITSIERYGVDFDDLAKYADAFNVVMFSKNYATPWYFETLTRNFKKLLKKPFYISLYVYGPGDNPKDVPTPAEVLTVTVRCARAGADGFLYLTDGEREMLDYQKAVVEDTQLRERLRSYGGKPVQEVLDRVAIWEKIIK